MVKNAFLCVKELYLSSKIGEVLKKQEFWGMNQLFSHIISEHQKHRLFTHILFWILIYSIGILADKPSNLSISQNIVLHSMMAISRIPIAYWVSYVVIPFFFDKKQYLWAVFLFLMVYYLNFCLSNLFKINVYPHFEMYVVSGLDTFSINHFITQYFFSNLGSAAVMVLIKLLFNRTEVQYKDFMLEKQKAEIELKLLKTQLNPHFLFNTLNNIYTLSLLNSPKTSVSIAKLSEILDYILYRCNSQTVSISQEIKLLENYIALEKLRYDEDLEVIFNKTIDNPIEIAPLILLSLVENAFKHGASEDIGNPKIEINLSVHSNTLVFSIENTIGANFVLNQTHSGIGLKNLRHQLDLIYDNHYSLDITQKEQTFKVNLTINSSLNNSVK